MDETEVEAAAQRAVRDGGCMRELAAIAYRKYWPNWKPRSVAQRVDQQCDPHNAANPMQVRLWMDILEETGSDEMLAQAEAAHGRGVVRQAKRERSRLDELLEKERRRVTRVEPRDRIRRAG